jgi:hypothetical protein
MAGPHKADLIRYAYLYLHGGVYLDIKTALMTDIDNILSKRNVLYTVLSPYPGTIFDGFIATPPFHPIFAKLTHFAIQMGNEIGKYCKTPDEIKHYKEYHRDQIKFFQLIAEDIDFAPQFTNYSRVIPSLLNSARGYYFLAEQVSENPDDCYDGLDRWGWCSWIYQHSDKVIKTRYADFPWDTVDVSRESEVSAKYGQVKPSFPESKVKTEKERSAGVKKKKKKKEFKSKPFAENKVKGNASSSSEGKDKSKRTSGNKSRKKTT